MVQSIPAMEMATLDQISLYLLQDEEFGLRSVVTNAEEAQLVNEAMSTTRLASTLLSVIMIAMCGLG